MFAASKTDSASTGGYQISRSLRFNEPDSTYLNRGVTSTGNRRTYTFSAWVKRSKTGTDSDTIIASMPSGGQFRIFFETSTYPNQLRLFSFDGSFQFQLITTQVFRDFSAWGHLVVAIDTTQATASNRVRVYWNGAEITSFGTSTYPSLNADLQFNQSGQPHSIGGTYNGSSVSGLYNGYITEFNFIDGQALTPSSFGETNAQTGVWQPKAYSGSYGTNGFYLNFSDNSNTTAATLGKDYSGNGNNWTPNNFSVTAGVGNDSMVDTPTPYGTDTGAGGSVRGNYCTWNPLSARTTTLTNGNLDGSTTSGMVAGTIGVFSGKWYWECTPTDTTAQQVFGIISVFNTSFPTYPGGSADSYGYYGTSGNKYNNSSSVGYGSTFGNGDVIGVALDLDAGTLTFYKNNTSQGVAFSSLSGTFAPAAGDGATNAWTANFGQRPFAYTAPSGYKALCTQNLPTPTIGATSATLANKYFDATLYTGTGSTLAVTNAGGFQPDWVWLKNRSNVAYHSIWDAVRGRSAGGLASNDTGAEQASTAGNDFVSFNSNGFSVGPAQNWNVDTSGNTYVGWQWKANGSGSTNTAGTITSTVSANTTSGFSVVTYTGTGSNATVGHGLGVAPSFIIIKRRDAGSSWNCYQANLGASQYIQIDGTAGAATNTGVWNNTAPTTSVFSIGTAFAGVNASGSTHVAYCFAPVAGFSAFGSYTGNGSTDGPFIFTGFRPAFLMIKRSSSTGDWFLYNNKTSTYNVVAPYLVANTSGAEGTYTTLDFLSNGFKLRVSDLEVNGNGSTIIFMAFAENPFKTSLAR